MITRHHLPSPTDDKLLRGLLLLCALVGLAASVAAAYVHYHLLPDPTYVSVCDVNATFNCTQVYLSRFSTVAGVPVAIFGAAVFALAGLLALAGLRLAGGPARTCLATCSRCRPWRWRRSCIFGYVSFFVLKTRLPALPDHLRRRDRAVHRVGGGGHGADDRACRGGLRATSAALRPVRWPWPWPCWSWRGRPRRWRSSRGKQCCAAAARAAPGAARRAGQQTRPSSTGSRAAARAVRRARDGAEVLVVKFNDFQCPACGHSYGPTRASSRSTGRAPRAGPAGPEGLSAGLRCNDDDDAGPSPLGCDAAVAVRLAPASTASEEAMETWLYDNQPSMTAVGREAG